MHVCIRLSHRSFKGVCKHCVVSVLLLALDLALLERVVTAGDEERMMSPLQATGSGRSSGNGIGLARCKTGAILQSQDAAGKQHSGTPAPLAGKPHYTIQTKAWAI